MLKHLVHFDFRELHKEVNHKRTTCITDGLSDKTIGLHPVERVFLPENKQYWGVVAKECETLQQVLLSERRSRTTKRPLTQINAQLDLVSKAVIRTKERYQRGHAVIDLSKMSELKARLIDYYWRIGDWVHENEHNNQLQEVAFSNIQDVLKELNYEHIQYEEASLRSLLAAKSAKMLVASIALSEDDRQDFIADQATRMFSLKMNRRFQVKASTAPVYNLMTRNT